LLQVHGEPRVEDELQVRGGQRVHGETRADDEQQVRGEQVHGESAHCVFEAKLILG